jgi:hypothetical protein
MADAATSGSGEEEDLEEDLDAVLERAESAADEEAVTLLEEVHSRLASDLTSLDTE